MRSFRLFGLFLAVSLPLHAHAATFLSEDTLVIDSPISDDTYAGGGKVTITDDIDGDLIVGGGDVTVQGAVDEDLMVAGGTVRVQEPVGDDVRIAAGETRIEANVGGDVIVFSGKVDISDATIFGDLIVMGGDVTLDGDVRGNVHVSAGSLLSTGVISGNLSFQGAEANIRGRVLGTSKITAERILLSDDTRFDSPVEYWVPMGEMDFGDTAKAGATLNMDLGPKHEGDDMVSDAGIAAALAALMAAIATYTLLASSLFIVLILALKKAYFLDSAKLLMKSPWKNMFYGFLYFACTPMIGLFFLITVIGVPIGLSIGALYVITIVFAKPLSSIVLAKIAEQHWKKKKFPMWQTALLSIFMYIILTVAGMIPLVGWIAVAAAVCGSFGAMMQIDYKRFIAAR